MPHGWKVYDMAKKITMKLIEAGYVPKDKELTVRGIIQITIEDEW